MPSANYTVIDLAGLPPPQAIAPVSAETELSNLLADFKTRYPQYSALVESDPIMKLAETFAYRLALEVQNRNEAIQAVMLAYAEGPDLDQIGANLGVQRLTITPADNTTIPPTPAVMEQDTPYRSRIQLAPEGLSTAGPSAGYIYFAKSASPLVLDADVSTPSPGTVNVYVLSTVGNGVPDAALLQTVSNAVTPDTVRPLTDNVQVLPATVVNYSITAVLTLFQGPDQSVVLSAAQAAAAAYAASVQRIGYGVATSGIYAALQQTGVQSVSLSGWGGDIPGAVGQAPYCTGINITVAGTPGV
ncbi:baseplate J/gp47 family protein [Nguyenibacter vanlangensis]|uniref:Baseplate J/gp47 family protein n=1 Tax=Nguyenibacter vanlangensis TaxID=1216886 RepID=A0ABZ3D2F6_9PROT